MMREVEAVLHKHYHNPDIEAARLILAAAAAHAFKTHVPVWVLAIAPPGSAKTDLLESLRGLPKSYFPDEITPKTFLSGKIDQPGCKRLRPAGLLHRIGSDGILVASDFSTYTADPRNFKVILPQLRRIYDGNYCREFGSDENPEEREWHGRLTIFAGAVPDIDRHYSLFQKLGERFVRVRWPRPAGVDAALRAMSHTDQVAAELRAAVHGLLMPILVVPQPEVFVPSETQLRIANLTELVALGRSHVERDRYKREIVAIPVVEGNTRLPMQLVQLARGSALLDGRTAVMEADYTLVCRAALDSLPPGRAACLTALIRGESPYASGLPYSVLFLALLDLLAVGLVVNVGEDGKQARLSETAEKLLLASDLRQRVSSHTVALT